MNSEQCENGKKKFQKQVHPEKKFNEDESLKKHFVSPSHKEVISLFKNHTHAKKVGHTSEFPFGIY